VASSIDQSEIKLGASPTLRFFESGNVTPKEFAGNNILNVIAAI
jgi:hypothetical protein